MTALQRAATIAIHPVEDDISSALNDVWTAARGNRRQRSINRPRIARDHLKEQATERETEIQRLLTHRTETVAAQYRHQRNAREGGHQHQWKKTTLIAKWADLEWRRRWTAEARGKRASTWQTPWTTPMISLYEGLSKAEATALFLMRTEVLGLNAWLASVQVPDILPRCPYGWNAQTVRHVLMQCPPLNRTELITQTSVRIPYRIPYTVTVQAVRAVRTTAYQ